MVHGQQWTVVSQVILAVGFMLLISCLYWTGGSLPFSRPNFLPNTSKGDRLAYAFRCLAVSIVPLVVAIIKVGNMRFNNIDTLGAKPTDSAYPVDKTLHEEFLVSQRILQNTLEQTVFHIVVVLALASTLAVDQLFFVPVLVFFFVLGRASFYVGYLYDSEKRLYRSFGFALTYLSSVAGLGFALVVICLNRN